jgi:Histidine kinase-, DNA gyrase B-, and HSP90-like ATPase
VTASPKYKLTLDLRVLDHLGIKLYSNAAAVLSEAVANSWDADAQRVSINVGMDKITIEDDGVGMNLAAINDRFLSVGYDKRAIEGEHSDKGRPYMGRKGIGKLALFSIADVIEVHTSVGKERHAFKLITNDVRNAIKARKSYYPPEIPFAGVAKGTRIVLHDLRKKRTGSSIAALRKRIARRFSIIGYKGKDDDVFEVFINGTVVGPNDREDLRAVEFLWEFGEKTIKDTSLPEVNKRFVLDGHVDPENHPEWLVRGWFGTSDEPKRLRHDEAGSLNGLVVIARGRLIQENILDKLNFSRVLVSYLTGQVDADFLDVEGEDDIATSDRQRLVEDDPRYEALIKYLRDTLVSIQDKWTDLRNEARGKQALNEIPALADWLDDLPPTQRPYAQRLLGLIRGIELDETQKQDRLDLYRSGMLAFERLRLREETHRLSQLQQLTAEQLLPLLSDLSTLEGSLYLEIVRVRLDVLREFENLVDENEKEKVLQKHLFDNLWLLDPGWERAAGSERLEQTLKRDYKVFRPTLTDKESKGRIDIRYRTNADQHILIELKRANRVLKVSELVEQGGMYVSALRKCLKAEGRANPQISVVFVVGRPLAEQKDPDGVDVNRTLEAFNGRVIHYETLIRNARESYGEYLKAKAKVDRIDLILRKMSKAGAA